MAYRKEINKKKTNLVGKPDEVSFILYYWKSMLIHSCRKKYKTNAFKPILLSFLRNFISGEIVIIKIRWYNQNRNTKKGGDNQMNENMKETYESVETNNNDASQPKSRNRAAEIIGAFIIGRIGGGAVFAIIGALFRAVDNLIYSLF